MKYYQFALGLFISLALVTGAQGITATQVGEVGIDSSRNYQETSIGYDVTGKTHQVLTDLGSALRDDQGFFVYTPNEDTTACYRVLNNTGEAARNLAAFHRSGQTFLTWDEQPGESRYRIMRGACPLADSVTVVETNDEPQPVLTAENQRGRVYTMFMDQDNWNSHVFRGQTYSFAIAAPTWYDGGSIPLSVHMEGHGSRYYLPEATPYDLNHIYLRIDDIRYSDAGSGSVPDYSANQGLSYGWYFGHPCEGTDPAVGGVCNYLEHAILRAVDHAMDIYNIDEDRVYAVGHSMGGTGALSLGIRYPEVFASIYASEPVTDFASTGDAGGTNWVGDVADSWGTPAQALLFHPVGATKAHLQGFDGMSVWTFQNKTTFVCDNPGRDTALITMAHGSVDNVVDTDTQGYPFYEATNRCHTGVQAIVNDFDHMWQGYRGQGMNSHKEKYDGRFNAHNFTFKKESFPALSNASGSSDTSVGGTKSFAQDIEWSTDHNAENNFAGAIVDQANRYEVALKSYNGTQTVDVTPRRTEHFNPANGTVVRWINQDLTGVQVASGNVTVQHGIVTVDDFRVSPEGNKLILTSSGEEAPIANPEPEPVPAPTVEEPTPEPEVVVTPEPEQHDVPKTTIINVERDTASSCSLNMQRAYKHAAHPGVWYVDETCTKRPFKNPDIFFSYFDSWRDVRLVTAGALNRVPNNALGFMPWGPKTPLPDMSLIKTTDDPNVYMVIGNRKFRYDSEAAFYTQGAQFSWVIDVDPRVVAALSQGPDVSEAYPYPDGIVFKYENSSRVYRLHNEEKRHYQSLSALRGDSVQLGHIIVMNPERAWDSGTAISRGATRSYQGKVHRYTSDTPRDAEQEAEREPVATEPIPVPEMTPAPEPIVRGSGDTITTFSTKNLLATARDNAVISWAVPLSIRDNVRDVDNLQIIRDGVIVPAQFTAMTRWGDDPDGNAAVSWLVVDAQLDLAANENATFRLTEKNQSLQASPLQIVSNNASAIVIDTGVARYELSKSQFKFFDSVTIGNTVYRGNNGIRYNNQIIANAATIRVEHQGPERITLWVDGSIRDGMTFTSRIHFYKNLAEAKVDFRIQNLNDAAFVNGQPRTYDIGTAGSIAFDDLSILVAGTNQNTYRIPQGERGASGVTNGQYQNSLSIVQESSGDQYWDTLQGYGSRMQAAVRQRASSQTIDGNQSNGPNQIAGWLDANGVTVSVERAWQNFPKAFRAENNAVEIGLFPAEWGSNHNFRPGEAKTHSFWIRHHGGAATDIAERAQSFNSPLRFLVSPATLMDTQAAGLFAPRNDASFPDYEVSTDFQINPSAAWRNEYRGGRTIQESIAMSNNYGYIDYGDIPTDFENLYSPYGHKYDSLRGIINQAYRNQDNETWWELAASGARHTMDIDIFHTDIRGYNSARGWWQGGGFGHCYHDEDSRTNPHRNYCNPLTQHTYGTAGSFLYAFMSGDTLMLDHAIESADNVFWKTVNSQYSAQQCAIDAGIQRCDSSRPGGCGGYEQVWPGRDGGNLYKTMIMAYMATGDDEYLQVLSDHAEYINCHEATVGYDGILGPTCNRFHMAGTHIRNVGHYLLLQEYLGQPLDSHARRLLSDRMSYMTNELWDANNNVLQYCYYDGVNDRTLSASYENWQLTLADAFAVGGLVLNRPELITNYGMNSFLHGSRQVSYQGSVQAYFSTKEFVNQVGFGNMFLYAWQNR